MAISRPSSRLALEQAWQPPHIAARMAHEKPAQGRNLINDPEAKIAGKAQRSEFVGKEPVQPIGNTGQNEAVKAAPAFVTLENVETAEVEAEPRRIENSLGEGGNVFQSKVEPLTGQWMNGVGGIANEGKARLHIG